MHLDFDTTVTARDRLRPNLFRLALAALVFTVAAGLFFGRIGLAQDDLNCSDFDSQAAAQAELRSDPSDPSGLDGAEGRSTSGIPGVACEDRPGPRDLTPVPGYPGAPEDGDDEVGVDGVAEGEDDEDTTAAPATPQQAQPAPPQTTPDTGGPPLMLVAAALISAGVGLAVAQRRLLERRG